MSYCYVLTFHYHLFPFHYPPSVCGVFLKNYTLVRFADKSVKPQT